MSVKAMTWVFDHSPYEGTSRLIHLALADVANDGHDNQLWLTQAAIAEKAHCSVKTVQRTIHTMIAEGYLGMIEKGGGRSKPDLLRLILKTGQNDRVSGDGNADISSPETRTSRPETRTSRPSTPLINSKNSREATQPSAPSALEDPLHGFADFWDTYPKRNGKRLHRGKCEELWKRLSLDERRAAWRGAKHYADACARDLTIACDPDRFLRRRDWVDWQEAASAPAGSKPRRSAWRGEGSLEDDLKYLQAREAER